MWAHLFHSTNNLIGKGHVKEKIFWGKEQCEKTSCCHVVTLLSTQALAQCPYHSIQCLSITHTLISVCLRGSKKGILSAPQRGAAEAERLRARSGYLSIGFQCLLRCPGPCMTCTVLAGRTQVPREIYGLVEGRQGMLAHCRERNVQVQTTELNHWVKARHFCYSRELNHTNYPKSTLSTKLPSAKRDTTFF